MTSTYYATNRRNIDRLREERDRAGLAQLIDVLAGVHGRLAADAAALAADARDAIAWLDATAPRTVAAGPGETPRVGDILRYVVDGAERHGIVLAIHGDRAITNLGDDVDLHP